MTPLRGAPSTNAQFLLEFNKSLDMPHHRVTMIDYIILRFYEKKNVKINMLNFSLVFSQRHFSLSAMVLQMHKALSCLSKER